MNVPTLPSDVGVDEGENTAHVAHVVVQLIEDLAIRDVDKLVNHLCNLLVVLVEVDRTGVPLTDLRSVFRPRHLVRVLDAVDVVDEPVDLLEQVDSSRTVLEGQVEQITENEEILRCERLSPLDTFLHRHAFHDVVAVALVIVVAAAARLATNLIVGTMTALQVHVGDDGSAGRSLGLVELRNPVVYGTY